MLDYENEILLNSVQDNQLSIFAKGIPLNLVKKRYSLILVGLLENLFLPCFVVVEQVLKNVFKTYASEVNLVFVLSSNPNEEQYFIDSLPNEKIMSITTEFSANERKDLYAHGGVFFVTSRILVVDFLKDVIPADKISGVIVLRAHNVIENSQVIYILNGYFKSFASLEHFLISRKPSFSDCIGPRTKLDS